MTSHQPKKTILLSVIIVSYNTAKLTLATLESLANDLQASSLQEMSEIFIVDNNSKDDTVSQIKNWRSKKAATQFANIKLHVIENKDNLGFAHANNRGIEQAKGEYIFLLNSDTIVQPGACAQMIATFEKHPIEEATAHLSSYKSVTDRLGMVSAQLFNTDGTFQSQGGDLPSFASILPHFLFLDDIPLLGHFFPSTQQSQNKHSGLSAMGWVAGTAVMVRRALIDEIGPLDQNIFMYGEDMEWCIRAKKHHWDVVIDHDSKITHIGSASSNSSRAIIGEMKAYAYIWAKHKPLWQRPLLLTAIKVACVLRVMLFDTILRQPNRAQPYKELLTSSTL